MDITGSRCVMDITDFEARNVEKLGTEIWGYSWYTSTLGYPNFPSIEVFPRITP